MASKLTTELRDELGLSTLSSVDSKVAEIMLVTGLKDKKEVLEYAKVSRKVNEHLMKTQHVKVLNLELKQETILRAFKHVITGFATVEEVALALFIASEADLSKFER